MKFICEKCRTKYSIADDKVRRKVLKIRCKNCGHIVVVRDPARAESDPDGLGSALDKAFDGAFGRSRPGTGGRAPLQAVAEAPTPMAALAEDIEEMPADKTRLAPMDEVRPGVLASTDDEWYLAVEGHQFGPMSFDELASRVKRGEARGETGDEAYVWRDGFDDWVEVASVPELRPYVPPPPPRSRSGLYPAAEITDATARPAMPIPPMPSPPPSPSTGRGLPTVPRPTPPQMTGPAQPPRPSPPPSQPVPGTPSPSEQSTSRQAPVPSLATPAPSAAPQSAQQLPIGALESGLRHLPSSFSGDLPEVSLPPSLVPTPVSPKTSIWIKVAAIGAIVSMLLGGFMLIYFVVIDRPARTEKPSSLGALAAANKPGDDPHAPATGVDDDPEPGVSLKFKPVTVQRSPKGSKRVPRAGTKHRTKTAPTAGGKKYSAEERRLMDSMGGSSGHDSLPKKSLAARKRRRHARDIKSTEIAREQRKHKRAIAACYQRALKRDNSLTSLKANIKVNIGSSGRVVSVRVSGVSNGMMRNCLRRVIGRFRFKPIGGNGAVIHLPLLFGAGG